MSGSPCIACGEPITVDTPRMLLTDRRKGLPGKWELATCPRCGVLGLVPVPTPEELGRYYAAYTDEGELDIHIGRGARHPLLRRLWHVITGDVDPRDFVRPAPRARVLDYGSGQATYLADFHARGIDVWGAEVTDRLVDACTARGLRVRKVESFDRIPFEDGEFDVVYLMQVFEHLRDPREFLRELHRVLKPGGELYLAVPNSASVWRRRFGENWVSGWFAPFHLAHYNATTLGRLAEGHGFTVRRSWSRTPDSWFRLNLRARATPGESELDRSRGAIDGALGRILALLLLRISELFVRERDCLVLELEKR